MSTPRVHFDDLSVGREQCTEWNGVPFTGTAYETNAAGKVIGEVPFVDGLEHGVAREWYDSGQLRSESQRAFGSKHGVSTNWHDNGQLESEAGYQYSVKVREKAWTRDGKLMRDWSLPDDDPQRALIAQLSKRFGGG